MKPTCERCNDTGFINGKKCHQCWMEGVTVSAEYVAKKLGFNSIEEFNSWNAARQIDRASRPNNNQEPH